MNETVTSVRRGKDLAVLGIGNRGVEAAFDDAVAAGAGAVVIFDGLPMRGGGVAFPAIWRGTGGLRRGEPALVIKGRNSSSKFHSEYLMILGVPGRQVMAEGHPVRVSGARSASRKGKSVGTLTSGDGMLYGR